MRYLIASLVLITSIACTEEAEISDLIPKKEKLVHEGGEFLTQEALNSLSGVTHIDGDLRIDYTNFSANTEQEISSLEPLSNLTHISGSLFIRRTSLKNLNGLNNLSSVGAIEIALNEDLNDASALSVITDTVSLVDLFNNPELKNFGNGTSLVVRNSISLHSCFKLSETFNFSFIDSTLTSLKIIGTNLKELDFLNGLTTTNSLWIGVNDSLKNLESTQNLRNCDKLIIDGNYRLEKIRLINLERFTVFHISGNFMVESLDLKSNLIPLPNIVGIRIWSCNKLTRIDGFNGLDKAHISISDNHLLSSINGFNDLSEVTFVISHHENLTSINAFQNSDVNATIIVRENTKFDDYCGLGKALTADLANIPDENYKVYGNKYNPSIDDLINGDCKK